VRADPVRAGPVDRVDVHDAGRFDVPGLLVHLERGGTGPGEGLEVLAGDPVLLPDPDGLQPAVAHIVPDRPDMQAEPARHLLDRVQLLGHPHPSSS
jgi:hypothetical protein